jgi:hypothetical protein
MPVASTIANAVAGIINVVDAFKAAGARTVLVPNLPDLGVVPKVTSLEPIDPGISAYVTLLTTEFNAALATALDAVSGINIIQFDTFDLLKDVVADPTAYGFTNSTDACYSGFVLPDPTATTCANPSQYVFWDYEHPTTAFATLLGNDLFAAAVPEPASVGLLGGGLVALAGLRRKRQPAFCGGSRGRPMSALGREYRRPAQGSAVEECGGDRHCAHSKGKGRADEAAQPGAEQRGLEIRRHSGPGNCRSRIAGGSRTVAGTPGHRPRPAPSDRPVGDDGGHADRGGLPSAA